MQTSILRIGSRAALAMMFLIMTGSVYLQAQEPCVAPALPVGSHSSNIFNAQQEEYLGDAVAEFLAHHYRVSSDDQLTAYLRQIATRLLKHMPPTQLHLQFFLVDLPDANAFNIAGGRVYVSPKIVALTRNEDELAGIVAHELGHLVVHQSAIDTSHEMEQVLHVTQVTDRRDVFDKFHRLIETEWRKPATLRHSSKESEDAQRIADRLAIYAMAGAGYSTEAFASTFDRLIGTEGKTGNWLSDVLGSSNPESRRLREMIRTTGALPATCIESAPKASGEFFAKWQAEVIDYSGWNSQEILHGY